MIFVDIFDVIVEFVIKSLNRDALIQKTTNLPVIDSKKTLYILITIEVKVYTIFLTYIECICSKQELPAILKYENNQNNSSANLCGINA